jgi:SAM-dependent methyltransferase
MDRSHIEEFLDSFIVHAAGATTIALLAIADRTGLARWLAAHAGATAAEVAAGAGLEERYVTEILSGLTAAGVVEHEKGRFTLPAEHALFITDEGSPYFMGGWLDMIPAAYRQIDAIADATVNGGGVAFEDFGEDMVRGLDRGNGPSQRVFLVKRWLPAVPGLVDRLNEGVDVADLGCGTGTAVIQMARAFPASRFTGYDVADGALKLARSRGADVANAHFVTAGVEEIPADPGFDLITTFDVIHDLADPLAGLTRIREALRPGGRYLMMEPAAGSDLDDNLDARGALLYGVSVLHCMTQSLAAGGAGLGAAWGRRRAEEMAREAGFSSFTPLDEISNRFSSFYLLEPGRG